MAPAAARRLLLALLALFALFAGSAAEAHTFYAALTRIDHNARAGTIEIVHRMTAHDVAAVLSFEQGELLDFEDMERMEALVDRYIAARFELAADGVALSPDFLGIELEGDELLAYYEAPVAAPPSHLAIADRRFVEELPEQRNRIVATVGDTVGDALISRGTTFADIRFGP